MQSGFGVALGVSSAYRNPESERSIDSREGLPFYKNSRHEYGDGVDFITGQSNKIYSDIQSTDWNGNIDNNIACVEPHDSTYSHARVDWRDDPSARNESVCPTTNGIYWGKH